MLSEKGAILLDKDLKERDPDCVHRHLLLCETVVLGFLVLKAFSNQPENTHIHRQSYCVLGPQWTEKMEHVWHKAPNVSILTKTPHITYSYSLPLIRGGLELNYLYMTLKETKHLQWTPSSWGCRGAGRSGIIKSPADLLSHGIHEILPLVLSPTKMPVHMKLPTPSSGTGTYNKEELVY